MDGEEFKECVLEVPILAVHDKGKTCYLAGGGTSEHTKEESLELLEASSQQISWKLGSFVIYQGIYYISCILYLFICYCIYCYLGIIAFYLFIFCYFRLH